MEEGQKPDKPGFVFKPGDESSELPAVHETGAAAVPEASPAAAPEPVESAPAAPRVEGAHVEWTASEYVANPKNSGWFMLLGLASALLAVIVYFVTKDVVSTVITAVLGLLVGIFAARQPRTLNYAIDSQGLHVGQRFYPYNAFKSFSVADEHAMAYISLQPLKRFMPPLSIHYDPADEEKIAQTLAQYLPFEDHKPDMVDNLSRRIRF